MLLPRVPGRLHQWCACEVRLKLRLDAPVARSAHAHAARGRTGCITCNGCASTLRAWNHIVRGNGRCNCECPPCA